MQHLKIARAWSRGYHVEMLIEAANDSAVFSCQAIVTNFTLLPGANTTTVPYRL
jgi:hypothetical protein